MSGSTDERVEILLVDDREDGLIALEAVLNESDNYRLVTARSGQETLDLLDGHEFAVILLDVQMPGMDGFETAARIRRMPRHRQIPIIFVTAINKDDRYVTQGYEVGAVDYMFKPFDPVILRGKVRVFVELFLKTRRLQAQARGLAERDALERRAQIQSIELENLRRYRNLGDSIPHLVLRANPDGNLDYHNELWSRFTGLSAAESRGIGWQSALHADDVGLVVGRWSQAMRRRQTYETEFRLRRADGVYRWHWLKACPELDPAGNVIAWLATATDVQERRSTEEALKGAQLRAEQASQAKTQFLANMSHEIRTPLNAIIGFTEILLDDGLVGEEREQSVAIIRRNGHQLMRIVDEILDISKVEAGGLELERQPTSILDIWTETRALMVTEAARKGVASAFTFASAVPPIVVTDPTRLRQILLNVIGNAVKFTRDGRVDVVARLHPADAEGPARLEVTVTDSGVGIEVASTEKIFQPFSQADSSTTRLFGGTGLGLPLSRRLARALGGDVRLKESVPGRGSTFEITVMVEVPEGQAWIQPAEPAEAGPRELGII